MASGTFVWYAGFFSALANEEVDLVGTPDTVKCMHTSATHTPAQDTHDYRDDLTNEVTGTNVVAGGFTCDNVTWTYTAGTNVWKIDHDDESIATATATGIKNSHWYDATPGTAGTDPLIGYVIWDTTLDPNAGTLAINLNAAGLATLTLS